MITTDVTRSVWPLRHEISDPELKSQMRNVPSEEAEIACNPSSERAIAEMRSRCPDIVQISSPVPMSQDFSCPFERPMITRLPSDVTADAVIGERAKNDFILAPDSSS